MKQGPRIGGGGRYTEIVEFVEGQIQGHFVIGATFYEGNSPSENCLQCVLWMICYTATVLRDVVGELNYFCA